MRLTLHVQAASREQTKQNHSHAGILESTERAVLRNGGKERGNGIIGESTAFKTGVTNPRKKEKTLVKRITRGKSM